MELRPNDQGIYPSGCFGFPGGDAVIVAVGEIPAEPLCRPDLEHSIVFRDGEMNAELYRASLRMPSDGPKFSRGPVGNRYQRAKGGAMA